mmetsp:Transcript_56169/g.112582  ORF Transcript_56169/g.112582 Transcript_56169/m.112582 type:complete len:216 (+) Transcript_56169:320-967(+)
MLGLHPRAGKDEIRKAYKEYVRIMHPDLNAGKVDPKATARFQKLTDAYNEVMDMTDDQFWLESFDVGITRMATKRVDGPSLNPWERRFRQWARQNDLLDMDVLEDDDVDCRRQAKLYLDRCDDDPTLDGCEIAKELVERDEEQSQPAAAAAETKPLVTPPSTSSEPDSAAVPGGSGETSAAGPIPVENVVVGGVLAVAGSIALAFVSIIVSAATG